MGVGIILGTIFAVSISIYTEGFMKILFYSMLFVGYISPVSGKASLHREGNLSELSLFSTVSEFSCEEVAVGYQALLRSPLYIVSSTVDKEFFDSKKIEPFIAENIFKHLDPNNVFFTEQEVTELKKTKKNDILEQLLSGDCNWYYSLFKEYELNKLELQGWYKNNILSNKSNAFIYEFIKFFNSKTIARLELLLQKPWAKISLEDINSLANFSPLNGMHYYIKNNKHFSAMQMIRFKYNSLFATKSIGTKKDSILSQAIKHIYNVAVNDGAVYYNEYKNHIFLAALVHSLDSHSFYKRNVGAFQNVENKVDLVQKSNRFQSKLLKDKTAYIKFSHFYNPSLIDNSVSEDFIQALKTLDSKASSLIIDVRDNLGGANNEVIRILGSLIYTSKIARLKSCGLSSDLKEKYTPYDESGVGKIKEAGTEVIWYAPVISFSKEERTSESLLFFCNRQPYFYKKPVVVLINQASASASEMLALGLQEAGIAVVVGSAHSFGKGTSQSNYNNLQLTELFWFSALGSSIQRVGVSSDIVLNFPLALKSSYSGLVVEKNLPRALPRPPQLPSVWFDSKNELDILNYYAKKKIWRKNLLQFLNKERKNRSAVKVLDLGTSSEKEEGLLFKEIFKTIQDWKNYIN